MVKKKKTEKKITIMELPDFEVTETEILDLGDTVRRGPAEFELDPDEAGLGGKIKALREELDKLKKEFSNFPLLWITDKFDELNEFKEEYFARFPRKITRTPRRHTTYVVEKDGERLAYIAKKVLGSSGRHMELQALNGFSGEIILKKGDEVKIPTSDA